MTQLTGNLPGAENHPRIIFRENFDHTEATVSAYPDPAGSGAGTEGTDRRSLGFHEGAERDDEM